MTRRGYRQAVRQSEHARSRGGQFWRSLSCGFPVKRSFSKAIVSKTSLTHTACILRSVIRNTSYDFCD